MSDAEGALGVVFELLAREPRVMRNAETVAMTFGCTAAIVWERPMERAWVHFAEPPWPEWRDGWLRGEDDAWTAVLNALPGRAEPRDPS